jgi:hypothetical protein
MDTTQSIFIPNVLKLRLEVSSNIALYVVVFVPRFALRRGERGDIRFDAASGGFIPRSPLAKHSRGRRMKALFPYFFAELTSPALVKGVND